MNMLVNVGRDVTVPSVAFSKEVLVVDPRSLLID